MHDELNAVIERDGDSFIAYCLEIAGANEQGRTADEARESLGEAIELILADHREDALQAVPCRTRHPRRRVIGREPDAL